MASWMKMYWSWKKQHQVWPVIRMKVYSELAGITACQGETITHKKNA
ncbi:hypothetical protein GBAR_LOCUS10193 [Geodia barretti]|uniref:Uncharacterized protein n=1 Tax=Geodia barretti TaxID=519541 RepID=A0AA35WCT0_GEOBA|nr:hypothetical protein GBAR_LOCUS10193 [Geodia barretti]